MSSCLPVGSLSAADQKPCSLGLSGIYRVSDQVAQHLPDLTIEAQYRLGGSLSLLDMNASIGEASFIDGECLPYEIGTAHGLLLGGLLVESERLIGDLRDPLQFRLRCLDVRSHLGLRRAPSGRDKEDS